MKMLGCFAALATAFAVGVGAGVIDAEVRDHNSQLSAVAARGDDQLSTRSGDDNGDGVIDEDESGWNCRTMGNRICGESEV